MSPLRRGRRAAPAPLLALSLAPLTACLPAAAPSPAREIETGAPPVVSVQTRWPRTTAIETFASGGHNPTSVEATSDGWVVLTLLEGWGEARDRRPVTRLYARPAEVTRWAEAVRAQLHRSPDTDSVERRRDRRRFVLGRGRVRIEAYHLPRVRGENVPFELLGCDGVLRSYRVSPEELFRIADRVERAARVASAASPQPVLPTLERPYYESETSCHARPLSTPAPGYPFDVPEAERRHQEVGVRFIVDTAGEVEAGSVAVLPGTPPRLEQAARRLVQAWRFHPAEWEGAPVRQVLTRVLVYDPDPLPVTPATPVWSSAARSVVRAGADGWVHVRFGVRRPDGTFDGYQEWFAPDSVDAWVRRANAFLDADSANPKAPPPRSNDPTVTLGWARDGNRYELGYQPAYSPSYLRLKTVGRMLGCGSASAFYGEPLAWSGVDVFAAAAREARARRASPAPPEARPYAPGELACAAYLPPIRARQPDALGVWVHPRGSYPESMARLNARAEVMTSFVVDTGGVPEPGSLVVMPGADPRAVAALRASIGRYRFRPAARAGVKVRAHVVRTWQFAPPPACEDENAGAECARVYGPLRR